MNQGKRRLNQSLRFVRAAPLNLRDCATSNPSLSSPPWMRGAPHLPVTSLFARKLERADIGVVVAENPEKCSANAA